MGKIFNNRFWRQILTEVCQKIDGQNIGLQVISPFGFELLEDRNFFSRNLRRFYAYIGIPGRINFEKDAIASDFKKSLFAKLTQIGTQFIDDIVIIYENETLHKLRNNDYICKPTDKLLDIQVRSVEIDILTDYANYIIAILDGLYREKGEGKDYNTCEKQRWRLYQLYIMQETIFGYLLPTMTISEKIAYGSISTMIRNSIQVFYAINTSTSKPSWQEKEIIHHLIKPRIEKMYNAVNSENNHPKIKLSCKGYHFADELNLIIDLDIYHRAIDKIKRTYLMLE
ncbi:MAG TPA: hypothetical protein VHA13_02185 [Gammaproteobacteria bacterium]|nr:hypothetical protein [Gammaproteobacteria bacterium]